MVKVMYVTWKIRTQSNLIMLGTVHVQVKVVSLLFFLLLFKDPSMEGQVSVYLGILQVRPNFQCN